MSGFGGFGGMEDESDYNQRQSGFGGSNQTTRRSGSGQDYMGINPSSEGDYSDQGDQYRSGGLNPSGGGFGGNQGNRGFNPSGNYDENEEFRSSRGYENKQGDFSSQAQPSQYGSGDQSYMGQNQGSFGGGGKRSSQQYAGSGYDTGAYRDPNQGQFGTQERYDDPEHEQGSRQRQSGGGFMGKAKSAMKEAKDIL